MSTSTQGAIESTNPKGSMGTNIGVIVILVLVTAFAFWFFFSRDSTPSTSVENAGQQISETLNSVPDATRIEIFDDLTEQGYRKNITAPRDEEIEMFYNEDGSVTMRSPNGFTSKDTGETRTELKVVQEDGENWVYLGIF